MTVETMPYTLSHLPVGKSATIVCIHAERSLRRRLLDMGMVTGETVTIKRVAPMGDPLEIAVKGYRLSLRKREASQIIVEAQA